MNHRIKLEILRRILPQVLKYNAPEVIPRTGEAAKSINCYSIRFNINKNPSYLVESYDARHDTLITKAFISRKNDKSVQKILSLKELDTNDIHIRHFYGQYDIYYSNVYEFAFNYVFKIIYAKIWVHRAYNVIAQKRYNLRSFRSKSRIELLKFIVDLQFHQDIDHKQRWMSLKNDEFSNFSIMEELYSARWFQHPQGNEEHNKVIMYLGSLVLSGELIRTSGNGYKITGKAIETIEQYNENERRHKDSLSVQQKLFWLTVLASVIGIISILEDLLVGSNFFDKHPFW